MSSQIKVYLNDDLKGRTRREVDADVVKEYSTYFLVRLPDGNIIKRKKGRDICTISTQT